MSRAAAALRLLLGLGGPPVPLFTASPPSPPRLPAVPAAAISAASVPTSTARSELLAPAARGRARSARLAGRVTAARLRLALSRLRLLGVPEAL